MKIERDQIVKLSPPWYTYHRKVLAMFGRDPEVTVKELGTDDEINYSYFILVSNKEKAQAIKALLINPVELGDITVTAYIFGPDENSEVGAADLDDAELVENALKGNPIFDSIKDRQLAFFHFCYCIFKKEVIQFWNDDLGDYYGNMNCLAEDLARELFKGVLVQFCTAIE